MDQAWEKVQLAAIPKEKLTPGLLRSVPAPIAQELVLFPFALADGILSVAVAEPLSEEALLRFQSAMNPGDAGLPVRAYEAAFYLADRETLIDYIHLYYGVGERVMMVSMGPDDWQESWRRPYILQDLWEVRSGLVDLSLNRISDLPPVARFVAYLLNHADRENARRIAFVGWDTNLQVFLGLESGFTELPAPPRSWFAEVRVRLRELTGCTSPTGSGHFIAILDGGRRVEVLIEEQGDAEDGFGDMIIHLNRNRS